MLINLFLLSACSKTNHFCVLKSIKSNRQSNFTVAYKACKENDNFIELDDFNNYIVSTFDYRTNFTIFGFKRKFPLKIDLSNTNIKYFDIRGGEKNQFVYFIGNKKDITIQGTRVNILFEETKISLKSAILSRSIVYSPNGKIDLFVKNLITDGFSLKNNFFSNISCYQYKLTSRIKPTAKVHILHDKNNIHSESSNEGFLINNTDNFSQKSDRNSKNKKEPDLKKYNKHYYHLNNSTNLRTKYYDESNYAEKKSQLLESEESHQRLFSYDSDFFKIPRYIQEIIDIKEDQIPPEMQNDKEELNNTEIKYCLCMKNRLNRCKESLECDSYFIPIENYVTGKEAWFKSDISHSANRTIRLYITATEGSIMNIGFEDFLGKNNTIYFILANPGSPAFVTIGGKYMSSSTSQIGVFSAVFNNIDQVSINSDIISKLNDVTLKQSPLIIRPSHHLTIHRLITDTRSIASFEGTLYISEFLVLNNTIPLLLEGTLLLDEGCIVYVPQISLFPNVFINDEYILFSDEDQDNDLVLYFTEVTNNSKKWIFYMSNEILIEDGQTYPAVNFYLKTNSESVIPILFIFDIQYQGISLIYDDISKLPSTINFEVVTSEDKERGYFLEIQIDYTDPPKNILFKKISGNIDLVLLTSKTIQYFLDNINPPSCFDQTESTGETCNGINLYGLNSLTFYVYFSMTKISFNDDSIMIYFGSDMISFTSSLTNTIQVIADLQSELIMSIAPGSAKLFPLSLIVISNNSVINFDDSFSYIVNSNDPDVKRIASFIYIFHDDANIDLVSSDISQIPSVIVDDQIKGVLYNTSTEKTYDVSKSTNFSENYFRSGPKVIARIVDENVIVPQSSFLAYEVMFCGKPFIFSLSCKSRSIYIFDNDVKINVSNDDANETLTDIMNENKKVVQKTDLNGIFSNNTNSVQSNINFVHKSDIDFSDSNSGYKASLIDHLSFNSNVLLEEKVEEVLNTVNVHGLVFTKSGKFSQNNDQISSPNIKIKLFADLIKCQTVLSINESNFDGAINVFDDFQLNDSIINIIELSIDSVRVSDTNRNSALLYQAQKSATFEVFYEADDNNNNNNLNVLNDGNSENKVIKLKAMNKEIQILKNFKLYVNSPATIFFDSSWYNVTNPEDLVIIATKEITLKTELLKMPNFTVKLLDSAHETIVIKMPKHTSKIAFYTFLGLAIAVFIACFVFCIIDFCCILKPKSIEVDLDSSSSSDHSLDNFPFTTSSSSLYEYYSDDEMQNKELENIEVAQTNTDDNNNKVGKSGISITAYGNTTAEWRAEHLKKRRKRPKEEEDELDNKKKKKKKKKIKKKNKKKKQSETELNVKNDALPREEKYYDDNNNNN